MQHKNITSNSTRYSCASAILPQHCAACAPAQLQRQAQRSFQPCETKSRIEATRTQDVSVSEPASTSKTVFDRKSMNSDEIVHTIIAQIGGRDFATKVMLKTPVRYSDNEATAEVTAYFDISVPNERGVNQIEVVYSFGSDTYRLRFWTNGKDTRSLQAQNDDVYCDQLVQFVNTELSISIAPIEFG
jgi:hypothetical protein